MDLSQCLVNVHHPDAATRQAAEAQMKAAEQQNKPQFLALLASELSSADKPAPVRQLAGIILKNSLDAKDRRRKEQLHNEWLQIDIGTKTTLKNLLVQTLSAEVKEARHTAAQVISKIGLIEVPRAQWNDLVDVLLNNIMNPSGDAVRHSSLEALGYLCEDIADEHEDGCELLKSKSDQILNAVVSCMSQKELAPDVRLAATRALFNSLDFIETNFNNDNERNYLMTRLCEGTQADTTKIRAASYECLVRIAQLYYQHLAAYMQTLLNITLGPEGAIKKSFAAADDDDAAEVAMQAIEFWTTVSEREHEINDEYEYEENPSAPNPCQLFIKGALGFLIPVLLEGMTKQDDDQDEMSMNVANVSASCLQEVAQTVKNDVLASVMQFVTQYISNPDWHFREAATLALGSVLEGPSPAELREPVASGLGFLLQQAIVDQHVLVRDTTAWTVSQICHLQKEAINDQMLPVLVQTMLQHALNDDPRVAKQCCTAFYYLAEVDDDEALSTWNRLTPHFNDIMTHLIQVTERPVTDRNLRTAAYEALIELITNSSPSVLPVVDSLIPEFMKRLTVSFQIQCLETQSDLQGLLCGVLGACIQKLETQLQAKPYCDDLMTLFLSVFHGKAATVHEDALLAIGHFANAMEAQFGKYLVQLFPFLLQALKNYEEHALCSVAVGVVGDCCRALNGEMFQYCNDIVKVFLDALKDSNLDSAVKPQILSAFGDIALAIGKDFHHYLDFVFTLMTEAFQSVQSIDKTDEDQMEFLTELREGIFEGLTGIIQGMKGHDVALNLVPRLDTIMHFINISFEDNREADNEVIYKCIVGVIGDVCNCLGQLQGTVDILRKYNAHVHQLFVEAAKHEDAQQVTAWAKKQWDSIVR